MDYDEIIRRVRRLDFIKNDETANAAVKAVHGILVSRLSEEQTRQFAEKFPEHLSLETLEGDPKRMETISVTEYTARICAQFKISVYQARTLMRTVLYFTKEAAGDNVMLDFKKSLPVDWADAIQNA
jgi:uncharacterized protein (DUF2267 family)